MFGRISKVFFPSPACHFLPIPPSPPPLLLPPHPTSFHSCLLFATSLARRRQLCVTWLRLQTLSLVHLQMWVCKISSIDPLKSTISTSTQYQYLKLGFACSIYKGWSVCFNERLSCFNHRAACVVLKLSSSHLESLSSLLNLLTLLFSSSSGCSPSSYHSSCWCSKSRKQG